VCTFVIQLFGRRANLWLMAMRASQKAKSKKALSFKDRVESVEQRALKLYRLFNQSGAALPACAHPSLTD
jgi:hypothetical protein